MNTQALTNFLFNMDPMNTSCKENEVFDEYEKEAILIFRTYVIFKSCDDLLLIVKRVFDYYFWDNCLSQQQIEEIANEISKLNRVH